MQQHNSQFEYPVACDFWRFCHFVLLLESELSSFLIDEHNEVHEAYCCSEPHDSTKAALSTANHQVYRVTFSVIRHSLCLRWRADWHQTPRSSQGLTQLGSRYPRRTEQVHGSQIHHLSAGSAFSILRDSGRDRGVCQELLQVRKCGVFKSCPTRLVESSGCQYNMGTVRVYCVSVFFPPHQVDEMQIEII